MIGFLLFYVTEAVKFIFGYMLLFRERLTRLWLYPVGAAVYVPVFLLLKGLTFDQRQIAISAILFIVTLICARGSIDRTVPNVLILDVFLNSYDALFLIPLKLHGLYEENNIHDYVIINLVRMAVLLIIFVVLYEYRRMKSIDKGSINLRINRFLPYWAALFLNFILYNETKLLFSYADPSEKGRTLLLQIFIATISILLIIRMVIYSTNLNDHLNRTISLEKELSDMKTEYYEVLLRKEEDTRRYRHDMMNHYICMKQYADEGRTRELSEYLSDIMGSLGRIRSESYSVGNRTIDIILNYYLNSLDPSTEKTVIGMAPEAISASETDLITIFGNLLSNASEELKRIENQPSMIRIEIKEGKKYLSVSIINTVSSKKQISEDLTVASEKHDSSNHGFGLRNVRSVVGKNGGRLELSCDDEAFTATVYLKL